ncbi:unannotated protein [freshwater metagenome]|uniref:Unannotated protein n=1 Tax=freshwater metagenome TaxID=449393 RepID=A0A6J6G940_9ZZZZ
MPSILIAETALGFCFIFPLNFSSSLKIISLLISLITSSFAVKVTSPSLSSVCVALPSKIVAWYDFLPSVIYGSNRVAIPTPRTKTPVAIGSKVPA